MTVQGTGSTQGTNGAYSSQPKHPKKPGEQDQPQGANWNNNPPVPLH